jgi:hypothetical protein
MRNAHKILVGTPGSKKHLRDLAIANRIILRQIFKEKCSVGWTGLT